MIVISALLVISGSMLASHGRRVGFLFVVFGLIGAIAVTLK